jgi:hypothetical protein
VADKARRHLGSEAADTCDYALILLRSCLACSFEQIVQRPLFPDWPEVDHKAVPGRFGNALQVADRRRRPAAFQPGDIALIGFDPLGQLRLREVCGRTSAHDRGGYWIAAAVARASTGLTRTASRQAPGSLWNWLRDRLGEIRRATVFGAA